jgi:hypothetical protein
MTTLDASPTPRDHETAPVGSLRQLVVADAVVTGLTGWLLLVVSVDVAEWAGLATAGPVRGVGAFFVVLAVALAGLSRTSDGVLVRVVPVTAVGDLLWAVVSVVVALAADLAGAARALILLQAVFVFAVGEAKLVLARRARAAGLS